MLRRMLFPVAALAALALAIGGNPATARADDDDIYCNLKVCESDVFTSYCTVANSGPRTKCFPIMLTCFWDTCNAT